MENDEREYQETEWTETYREMRRVPRRRQTRKRQEGGKPSLLLAIQLSACAVVLAAALVLRLIGGEWLAAVQSWYWDHLNSSIVAQEDWNEVETRILELVPEGDSVSSQAPASSAQSQ